MMCIFDDAGHVNVFNQEKGSNSYKSAGAWLLGHA
jgi:hypothetical protein